MCFWGFENLGGPLLILLRIERVPHYHCHGLVDSEIYFIIDVEDARIPMTISAVRSSMTGRRTHSQPGRLWNQSR